jgi:hypothetical protein
MALLVVHPWAQFFAGMLIGCWMGAAVACAGLLLFIGRKVRQLESINSILRKKLKARASPLPVSTAETARMLVMTRPDSVPRMDSPLARIAQLN